MLRHPPATAPRPRALQHDKISFYHPGYSRPVNLLFSLPRVDPDPAHPGSFGVHARTALVACQIVANNAFDGYLAADEAGTSRVESDPQAVLTGSDYWFFVEGDEQYPIVPSFRDWEFPHGRVPSCWLLQTEESSASSRRCHITKTQYSITSAHFIPREELDWFSLNGMHKYGSGRGDIHDACNTVPLRSDIHICLDLRECAFVPKPDGSGQEAPALHVLKPSFPDFAELYHNKTLLGNYACGEYLFARFAWAVIQLVKPFVTEGFGRRIARFGRITAEEDTMPPGKELAEARIDWLKGDFLKDQYGGGGSKSASPTKGSRKRKADGPEDWDNDDEQDLRDDWYAEHLEMVMERENPRGRKRARGSNQSFPSDIATPPLSYSPAAHSVGSRDIPGSPESDMVSSQFKLGDLTTRSKAPVESDDEIPYITM
ncbi:hypothetical protein CEP51_015429 [Fusarium floridanum]|uniref:HNH nuclease domain-containing protein n=1 Tax=Fusarium floridanum TaxID=1325733 RepID=A0A428PA18_9HYPO|nr:hypothetical protein CEP51_015429 [Fusarium floridanum]